MRFILKVLLIINAIALINGCSNTTREPVSGANTGNWCTYNDGVTPAPEFFCTGDIKGYAITGRGSSAKSEAGMNYMVQQAALSARVELANNIRTHISSLVKDHVRSLVKSHSGTTGVVNSETVDKMVTSTSQAITDEVLLGSKIVRRAFGHEGEVYIWVAIDEENLAKSQNAILSSLNNEQAL